MFNEKPMYSAKEASEVLGVSQTHVARLVKSGQLTPAVKAPGLRGAFLFSQEEVEQVKVMRELQTAGKPKK